MILDHIEGHPLIDRQLSSSSGERRRQFYSELIDIFIQLRRLEFSAAGSLMPGNTEQSYSRPAISSAFSIPSNDLKIQGYSPSSPPPQSTEEFISQQRQLLYDFYSLPTQILDQRTAELELFAIHALSRIPIATNREHEKFVLSHTDLRPSNIIVDNEFHIVGVIDWEWAYTVPASLFAPPSWITASKDHLTEFRSVLALKDPSSQLPGEWSRESITLRVGEIFRQPHHLVRIFYDFIYANQFPEPRQEVVSTYFLGDIERLELQRMLNNSKRYTKYLKENNLFDIEDEKAQREEAQQINEWMAKVQEFYGRKE